MADELKLKIVLDDGSVREGFLSLEKAGAKTADKIGQNFDKKGSGISSLAGALQSAQGGFTNLAQSALSAVGPYGLLAGAIGGSVLALGKFALAGEKVNAVNAQFANVAIASGLAVDEFSTSIIKATDGLIDDEDALQIATKGIIALGKEASKIPEILEQSRAVSRALGKDFKSTFEDLSQFVETGNARVLRQFGIILDLDKAYKKAAESVGLTTAELTEQQKQTVRTNLVLDELPKKFGAAAQSVTPLADAFDRLRVKASNALEAVQSSLAEVITKAFVDEADLSNVSFNRITAQLTDNLKTIDGINKTLADISASGDRSALASTQKSALLQRISELRGENRRLQVQGSGLSDQALFAGLDASRDAGGQAPSLELTAEQQKLLADRNKKNLAELQKFQSDQDKIVTDSELKRIDLLRNFDQQETAIRALANQQQITLEQQKNVALSQVDEQFSAQKGFTADQREQARLSLQASFYQRELDLAKQQKDQLVAIEQEKNLNLLNSSNAYFSGFTLAANQFAASAGATFKELGKQAFTTITKGVGGAFAAYGAALKNGENANKAFLESTLKFFGDLAVNIGSYYIALGAAKLFGTPADKADAFPLIAAGAALAVLGGVLGAGNSKSPQSDTGGGIASQPSTGADLAPTSPTAVSPQTQVQVVVQGNVFDSDETGMRIVDLLNQSFDKQGVVIQQGAFV